MRVAIVEADVKPASLIRRGLREDGIAADIAIDCDGLWMAAATDGDAIVAQRLVP